jgi:hypothetical protein
MPHSVWFSGLVHYFPRPLVLGLPAHVEWVKVGRICMSSAVTVSFEAFLEKCRLFATLFTENRL